MFGLRNDEPKTYPSSDGFFPGLVAIGMVERHTAPAGGIATERHFYRCSKTLGRIVRSHSGVENRLHRVLVVVFHDDLPACDPAANPPTWRS